MIHPTTEDVFAAARAVLRGASPRGLVQRARRAAMYRRMHGRVHPTLGDGSLCAAAAAFTGTPARFAIFDPRSLRALAMAAIAVADAMERHVWGDE